jgi:YidC/Oxa1 family membrane protein insertase
MGEQRNLFIAIGIAIVILLAYQMLVLDPAARRAQAERARQVEAAESLGAAGGQTGAAPAAAPTALTRAEALALSGRVPIRSPEIDGSIALTGGLIDDVSLARYTVELDPASGEVTVFNPAGSANAYYAELGWIAEGAIGQGLPGPDTRWRLVEGETLTPETPVTLAYDAPSGLQFRRRFEIDKHFMFTVTDRIENRSGGAVELRPYARVLRRGVPENLIGGIVHEGMVGVFGNDRNGDLQERRYKRMQNDREYQHRTAGGWLGITDKYWLAAVIPHPTSSADGEFRVEQSAGAPLFTASWIRDAEPMADGGVFETESYVFAGAKRAEILRDYQATLGIQRFSDAIDWGRWFWFLTKPFFFVLEYFAQLTGNFGVAILILVVVLKAFTFPLANMSFKSMARMKALQPKVKELQERFKADPQRQQKEMMALYQREKVNPLAGCLPLFVQIPVFYALYKTLFVTIEMRHAPFIWWIRDLSARDPTNVWNLFGLLPYDPSSIPWLSWLIGIPGGFLALGVLPLLYGVTMAALQTLNPPPADPMQQRVFALMPWIFMFIMAPFAAGLLIYWIWNNILSFAQQYVIMRRQGVETPIGAFVAKRIRTLAGKPAPAASGGDKPGPSGDGGAS